MNAINLTQKLARAAEFTANFAQHVQMAIIIDAKCKNTLRKNRSIMHRLDVMIGR